MLLKVFIIFLLDIKLKKNIKYYIYILVKVIKEKKGENFIIKELID